MFCALSKPLRTVFQWQVVMTAVLASLGGMFAGLHGAVSAVMGGLVSIVAGLTSGVLASRGKAGSAGEVLYIALRAEGAKIGLIVALLWLVFANYNEVVPHVFLGSFLITVLIFSMAFFVREN